MPLKILKRCKEVERYQCSLTKKLNLIKMTVLSEPSTDSVQSLSKFHLPVGFVAVGKLLLKCFCKCKKMNRAKATLRKKKLETSHCSSAKSYYPVTIIKSVAIDRH